MSEWKGAIYILKLMIKHYEKRGGGYSQKEALNTALKALDILGKVETKVDFEGFLMEKHAEDYIGTKDCMVDDFNDWVQDLDVDDFIKYGNQFAEQRRSR